MGYDGFFALLWGRDIVTLHVPDYAVALGPTPHPLANVLGGLLSIAGSAAPALLQSLVMVSFAAVGLLCWKLGAALISPLTGAILAVVVLTRPVLVDEALGGSLDIFFLALVLAAAVLEASVPRRGDLVLAVLVAAGLLRPEAWLLSAGYVAFCWQAAGTRRLRLVSLALLAPLAWALADLLVTGNPVYSLTRTRDLASQLERAHSLGSAVRLYPQFLQSNLGPVILWCGLVGTPLVCWRATRRALIPATFVLGGLVGFLALGLAQLPLLTRYALIPTLGLAFFAAALLGNAPALRPPGLAPVAWRVVGVCGACVALLSIPDTRSQLAPITNFFSTRAAVQDQLLSDLGRQAVRRAASRCRAVIVGSAYQVPLVAWADGLALRRIAPYSSTVPGLYIDPTGVQDVVLTFETAGIPGTVPVPPKTGAQLVASSAMWQILAAC